MRRIYESLGKSGSIAGRLPRCSLDVLKLHEPGEKLWSSFGKIMLGKNDEYEAREAGSRGQEQVERMHHILSALM